MKNELFAVLSFAKAIFSPENPVPEELFMHIPLRYRVLCLKNVKQTVNCIFIRERLKYKCKGEKQWKTKTALSRAAGPLPLP